MKKLFVTLLSAGFISLVPSSLHPFITFNLSAQIPSDGLVAWYPFNGNANDESGNGNHGVVNGATLTTDRFGNAGGAYSFDGISSLIEVLNSSHPTTNFNITYSIWYKCFDLSQDRSLMSVGSACCFNNRSAIHKYVWGNLGYVVNGPDFSTNYNFILNEWHHVVLTKQSSLIQIFIDGQIFQFGNLNYDLNINNSNVFIGGNGSPVNNNGEHFLGYLDDISIYNRVLSSDEIQQLYQDQTGQLQSTLTCSITAPTTTLCAGESVTLSVNTTGGVGASSQLPANLQQGLVAYYPFNGNANDESGNGNNGVVNGATLTSDRFGNAVSAYGFDGVNDFIQVSSSNSLNSAVSQITVSVWFKWNGQNYFPIMSKSNLSYSYGNYRSGWYIPSPGIQEYYGTLNSDGIGIGNSIDYGTWNNLVYTIDDVNNIGRVYLNGAIAAEGSTAYTGWPVSNSMPLLIGADIPGAVEYANGNMDDILIYNRALSPSEIQQLYTAQSYAWSNNATTPTITVSPTQNTTYTCTVTQGNQTCTASVDITVNPNVTNTISATIIEGETYTLGTQSLTTAGTYTEVFTSAAGCDSTVTLTLSVEPALTCEITAPTTTLCEGESVTLSVNTTGGAGASSQLPANLQQGLVAYYPFNGNANDESGNGNNGVVNGATLTSDRFGNVGSAYSFDGVNDAIITNASMANFGTSNFSILAWVNINDMNFAAGVIAAKRNASGHGNFYEFGAGSNGLYYEFNESSGDNHTEHNIETNNILNWIQIALVRQGTSIKFYKNGQLIEDVFNGVVQNFGNDAPFTIGARFSDSNLIEFFTGVIDDLFVYNISLTSSEIQQLYSAQSYAWSNNATTPTITVSPSQNTTYNCTVTQVNQTCTASVDITVNPNVTNAISATIIEGETYTLGAQSLTTAGTYTEVFTSATGCDSTVTLTLSVEPLLTCEITAPTTTLCEGESLTLSVNTTGGTGASSQLPANLQQGLVAYYPFNGNANDESGNGNDGLVGNQTLVQDRFGEDNKAYRFNRDYSKITVQNSILPNSITPFSISLWFKPESMSTYAEQGAYNSDLLCDRPFNGWFYKYRFIVDQFADGSSGIRFYTVNETQGAGLSYSFDYNNDWNNVIVVSDVNSGVMRMYFNGVLVDTYSGQLYYPNQSSGTTIGGNVYPGNANGDPSYLGSLDEIRIYNRALSPSEIQQLYTAQSYAWSTNATTPTITIAPTANATYSCTITQGNQTCTASVDITVNPAITNAISATIVEGQSYTLGTQNLTTAGTYTEVFNSAAGCDSTVTLTLNVEPLLTCNITAPTTTLCEGESVTLSVNTTGGAGASSQLPANLQQGLVAYYPFNGNANDESGNGNNGVVNGATLTSDRFGNAGSAYSFDGVDDFISAQISSSLLLQDNRTYGCWFKAQANNDIADHGIFGIASANGHNGYYIYLQSTGRVFSVEDNYQGFGPGGPSGGLESGWTGAASNDSLYSNDGNWNFILSTKMNGITRVYINGFLQDQTTERIPNFLDANLYFGWTNFWDQFFSGEIDDAFIYNRVLSETEIQQLYTAQSYAWSTNETTPTISVSPVQNTAYSCTVTQGNQTCTASVDITVNPNVTNAISATIIEGETYTLGTQTLTTAGTYTEVFTSAAGCDSTVTLTLAVEPLLTCITNVSNSEICQGDQSTISLESLNSEIAIPVDLTQFCNYNWENSVYHAPVPFPRGEVTLGGVPFSVPSSGNNAWNSHYGPTNILIPINEQNVHGVYFLVNTFWGSTGNVYSSVVFQFSNGTTFTKSIVDNEDVRDYNYPSMFPNSINNTSTINVYNLNNRVLDLMFVQFPPEYLGLELSQISINDFGGSGLHRIIITGLTLAVDSSSLSQVLWSTGATTPSITVSPTQTTTYTATVTTATQACTDSISITVNPLLTWYADADADGFGNPDDVVQDCNQPLGYIADNTDCNDADATTYPGASEICDNNRDENCDGVDSLCFVAILGCTDVNACNFNPEANTEDNSCILPQPETCNGLDDNCNGQIDEGLSASAINAVSAVTALYPVCSGNSIRSANLNNGANSAVIEGNGNDLWYSFTAQYNTFRAGLSAATGDNDVRLYTMTPGGCLELIETEHENTSGNQVLLSDQLTVGQTYYVAVHNISGPMNASAKICFNHLTGSTCDHYYSNNTGIYSSVCNSFKAQYRANAVAYTFDILSATQNNVNQNITPWSYTTTSASTVVGRLGTLLPANQGTSPMVYTLKVPALYSLFDAAGNFENLFAQATTTCTVTLNAEATIALRSSDRCPTNKSLTSTIAPDRTVCGAMRYDWEFTEVLPNPGTVQVVQGGNYTTVFFLSNVPGITAGKTYNVRVRPVHSSGITGNWGAVQCLRVGSAGMVQQSESESESVFTTSDSPIHRSTDPPLSLYPNPTTTGSFVLNYNSSRRGELTFAPDAITGLTSAPDATAEKTFNPEAQELVMMNITGKVVFKTNVVLNGNIAEINFGDLESGLYLVDFGGERSRVQVVK